MAVGMPVSLAAAGDQSALTRKDLFRDEARPPKVQQLFHTGSHCWKVAARL
jgi:hypothetical protein